ncbi:allophanate hydrolase [Dactylosporangium vinaceum]|uniref:Allophanate hydrolase n=1 Tax=Dactylosporangium vinaceum TaxID=53362 RepID=A0ABV5M5W3_9ACTN|nr:allophanate hydrolase [Dactylosporangium vinaceum]UAC01250.1 allophanate hydrolase [Dactylosporangium vinaceum]
MNGTTPIWISRFDPDDIAAREAAAPDGPLRGQLVAVKDNIDVAGLPTTAACPALADRVATRSATAVSRLEAAGAVPVGKTNMDQFATGLVGTRSPYGACSSVFSDAHISGGSSSGSAVAVAAGLVPLALGTDTAGSGRVPAAFNGIVGLKPTRGLVPAAGLLPACRSLDCVTTFTRTVAAARTALAVLAGPDPADPWSRPAPPRPPAHIAARPRVIGVPAGPLDLDPEHAVAWKAALEHAARLGRLVPVAVDDFLAAAALLYGGPWLAERWAGFGALLDAAGPHADPAVRAVVTPGRDVTGAAVFAGLDRLAGLRQATEPVWLDIDALLLPTTPGHPRLADVAADPLGVNARLGTYTNFVNLLDLCVVAVPGGSRPDGLPFGVQLIGPAFADRPLLDLAARWTGEAAGGPSAPPDADAPAGTVLLAVAGAHMSGLPLNGELLALGAALEYRARTGPGYRLYRLPGPGVARPGLVDTGDGPAGGIAVEVWRVPRTAAGALLESVPAPLGLGRVRLDDGTEVLGFLAEAHGVRDATDVSAAGSWRRVPS